MPLTCQPVVDATGSRFFTRVSFRPMADRSASMPHGRAARPVDDTVAKMLAAEPRGEAMLARLKRFRDDVMLSKLRLLAMIRELKETRHRKRGGCQNIDVDERDLKPGNEILRLREIEQASDDAPDRAVRSASFALYPFAGASAR